MSRLPDDLATELRRDDARATTHNRPDESGFDCGFAAYEPLTVAAPGETPTCRDCLLAERYRERLAARAAACADRGAVSDLGLAVASVEVLP